VGSWYAPARRRKGDGGFSSRSSAELPLHDTDVALQISLQLHVCEFFFFEKYSININIYIYV
jgi:hypothetical protein